VWNSGKSKHYGVAKARQRRDFPLASLGKNTGYSFRFPAIFIYANASAIYENAIMPFGSGAIGRHIVNRMRRERCQLFEGNGNQSSFKLDAGDARGKGGDSAAIAGSRSAG
jgi:hypothetical protein